MLRYILRRLLLALPTLIFVAVGVFALVRLIPGDPALVMLGEGATPEAIRAVHKELGLDQPLPVQFATWAWQVLHGNLGTSIVTGEPVAGLILHRFALTATIVLAAVALATALSVPGGLLAAWQRNRKLDMAISSAASLMLALPTFWLGLVLLLVFGVTLRWFPVVGYVSPSEGGVAALSYLVLPIVTLTIAECGSLVRMMRASTIEVLSLDFITHARAKGLPERTVLLRHALPNAFAPTLTLVGLTLGHLLGGAVVTETVFTLPGLGRLMVTSVLSRDYPVVQGCLLFTAAIYVAVNLLIELLYPLFDPRVTTR